MRIVIRWPAWVCLSLMLWTTVVESTHHHPKQTQSASCSICVVAHSSRPVAAGGHTGPVFATIGWLREKEVMTSARLDAVELGIRGPPVL